MLFDQLDEPLDVALPYALRAARVAAVQALRHQLVVANVRVPEVVREKVRHLPIEVLEMQTIQDRIQVTVAGQLVRGAMRAGDRREERVRVAALAGVDDRATQLRNLLHQS